MDAQPSPTRQQTQSLTDERFSVLVESLQALTGFFHQVLNLLYVLEPPHSGNYLIKFLRPLERPTADDLARWRLDPEHGLLHGLVTAYFAVKCASEWSVPALRDNGDLQRLVASCFVHDYARVACGEPRHDDELRRFFPDLLPETYTHANPVERGPLVRADRIELLRYEDRSWIDHERVVENLPDVRARSEVDVFYRLVRPALARLFRARTAVWLRHGAEESDWRANYPDEPMVSRSKDLWPNFYYPWQGFPDYWAVEVGELTPGVHRKHLVDYFFPAGLLSIDEYRAAEPGASIVSAPGREHEIAYGRIPLREWIVVFQDDQLTSDRYLVTGSGGVVSLPLLTIILDVADSLYSKLAAIG